MNDFFAGGLLMRDFEELVHQCRFGFVRNDYYPVKYSTSRLPDRWMTCRCKSLRAEFVIAIYRYRAVTLFIGRHTLLRQESLDLRCMNPVEP